MAAVVVPTQDVVHQEEPLLLPGEEAGAHRALPRRPAARRAALGLGALGLASLAALAASLCLPRRSGGSPWLRGDAHPAAAARATGLAEVQCAAADAPCLGPKCCENGGESGLQCYAKDDYWATCAASCEPGVHPGPDASPWSCKALGERSLPAPEHCPKEGANCLQAPCCQAGGRYGLQCFQTNVTFAVCKETCLEQDGREQWNCKALGARSAPAPEFCPKSGENCIASQCCEAAGPHGLQCYRKNKYYGGCMPPGTCKKGLHPGEKPAQPWSCDPLGVPSAVGEAFCPMMNKGCLDSKCCGAGGANGLQCYQLKADYAQCRETCNPDTDGRCTPLGQRSSPDPCSAPGENCAATQCCSAERGGAGMTCFEKDASWSACLETCEDETWSCRKLGNRTKYQLGCSWAGTDCSKTRACCNDGFECAVKDSDFTGCVQVFKKSTWMKTKVPLPADWQGTVLGYGRGEYAVQPAGNGIKTAGTSLYCFMAILPNSSEVALKDAAKKNNLGMYGCDAHDLFWSWPTGSMGWDTGTSTLVNTDVFIHIFDQFRAKGAYLKHDWTVKADADCVFVPARLRQHIQQLRPPAHTAVYLKNNGMDPGLGNNGFLGAIEVFSTRAMQIYFDNADACQKYFGLGCGEDGFYKGCMDSLGVGYMLDVDIFFPDHGAGACRQAQRVAFHPLKTVEKWQHCADITTGKTQWRK